LAGKTTLINQILTGEHGKKIAVIENEFGEVMLSTCTAGMWCREQPPSWLCIPGSAPSFVVRNLKYRLGWTTLWFSTPRRKSLK
jgi:hypothetical protein